MVITMVNHKIPEDVWDEFLARISSGESGRKVCRDKSMPSWGSVWKKIRTDDVFRQSYSAALESRGMVLADNLDEIMQQTLSGMIDPSAARVAADIIKWQAARMTPKVYGEKAHMTVETKGGGYIEEMKRVEDAIKLRISDKAKAVLLEEKDTQDDALHARDEVKSKPESG
jgi:hypothetical protein